MQSQYGSFNQVGLDAPVAFWAPRLGYKSISAYKYTRLIPTPSRHSVGYRISNWLSACGVDSRSARCSTRRRRRSHTASSRVREPLRDRPPLTTAARTDAALFAILHILVHSDNVWSGSSYDANPACKILLTWLTSSSCCLCWAYVRA